MIGEPKVECKCDGVPRPGRAQRCLYRAVEVLDVHEPYEEADAVAILTQRGWVHENGELLCPDCQTDLAAEEAMRREARP